MRHMHGGAQIVVEGLRSGKAKGLVGCQVGRREALRNIGQDGGGFGQHTLLGQQGRHPGLGIDGQVLRRFLVVAGKVQAHRVVNRA